MLDEEGREALAGGTRVRRGDEREGAVVLNHRDELRFSALPRSLFQQPFHPLPEHSHGREPPPLELQRP